MRDNVDQIVEELQAIRGALGDVEHGDQVNVRGRPLRTLQPGRYTIKESSDMDDAEPDGSISVAPGDTRTVVRHNSDTGTALLAVGVNDDPDARYQLVVDDNRVVGGETQAPLGTPTDLFSFVDTLNGAIPADSTIEYQVKMDPNASSSSNFTGVLHTDDLPRGGP